MPADPDVEFEFQSPYQSDLPANPNADLEFPDLEPQSPVSSQSVQLTYGTSLKRVILSEADNNSDPPGVRKEAAKNSATKVQRAAAENLRAVGPVRGWREISKTTTEGLLLS